MAKGKRVFEGKINQSGGQEVKSDLQKKDTKRAVTVVSGKDLRTGGSGRGSK
ncbi:MAG: hypothetical protein LBN00_09940 [Oscillospiraceae bacterium]|jgi:hypothetical protein|nr:hypothetical protein [Oscillospiraceae bacterium]